MLPHPAPQLPEDILSKLPTPSEEAVASGIESMISMVTSMYDDVAVNGCASVAKLAAASSKTRENMAASSALVIALLNVVTGMSGQLSVDTRTNAALALAELVDEPVGQRNLLEGDAGSVGLASLLTLCKPTVAQTLGVQDYEALCFRTYWYDDSMLLMARTIGP